MCNDEKIFYDDFRKTDYDDFLEAIDFRKTESYKTWCRTFRPTWMKRLDEWLDQL